MLGHFFSFQHYCLIASNSKQYSMQIVMYDFVHQALLRTKYSAGNQLITFAQKNSIHVSRVFEVICLECLLPALLKDTVWEFLPRAQYGQWVFESCLPLLIYVIRPCHPWSSHFQVYFSTRIWSKGCAIHPRLKKICIAVRTVQHTAWPFCVFFLKKTAMKVVGIQEKNSRVLAG